MLVLDSLNPYYYKVFRDDQDFSELVISYRNGEITMQQLTKQNNFTYSIENIGPKNANSISHAIRGYMIGTYKTPHIWLNHSNGTLTIEYKSKNDLTEIFNTIINGLIPKA